MTLSWLSPPPIRVPASCASGFGSHRVVEQKGRLDPVTEIDRASEAAIVSILSTHRPEDGLLGEEGTARGSAGRRWIIDPLDGTVNFIHGIPQVAVSVALWDGDQPLAGVVVDVIRDEVFAAASGKGATRDGAPIQPSSVTELHRAVVATGFPYDHDLHAVDYLKPVAAVLARVNGLRRIGSAALDLCWVACGRFDAYWEYSISPWDGAAGAIIAAGGRGHRHRCPGAPARLRATARTHRQSDTPSASARADPPRDTFAHHRGKWTLTWARGYSPAAVSEPPGASPATRCK